MGADSWGLKSMPHTRKSRGSGLNRSERERRTNGQHNFSNVRCLFMEPVDATVLGASKSRSALIILFIPSADRDGKTLGTQDEWKGKAVQFFGDNYGGAT